MALSQSHRSRVRRHRYRSDKEEMDTDETVDFDLWKPYPKRSRKNERNGIRKSNGYSGKRRLNAVGVPNGSGIGQSPLKRSRTNPSISTTKSPSKSTQMNQSPTKQPSKS